MDFFKKIAIIGVGLLGGSIGLYLKKHYPTIKVVGIGRSKAKMHKAIDLGAIDTYFLSDIEGVKDCDLIVIATPINTISDFVKRILPELKTNAIITDVGSTKKQIIDTIKEIPEAISFFVGSHPMAGSDKDGIDAADEGLYNNKTVVVTETENINKDKMAKIILFWEKLGANVIKLSPEAHDEMVGFTSHLPHLIASTLSHTLMTSSVKDNMNQKVFGNGLLDTTRIAKGSPSIWMDIITSNKQYILDSMDDFRTTLDYLETLIANDNLAELNQFLTSGKEFRRALIIVKNVKHK